MTDRIEFFDLNDCKVGEVSLSKAGENAAPRIIAFRGKRYQEGGGEGSFYERLQAAEIPA